MSPVRFRRLSDNRQPKLKLGLRVNAFVRVAWQRGRRTGVARVISLKVREDAECG